MHTGVGEVPGGVVHQLVRNDSVAVEAVDVRHKHLPLDDPLRHPRGGGALLLVVDGKVDL